MAFGRLVHNRVNPAVRSVLRRQEAMPVMASLFVVFGLPSPSLSFPPHIPRSGWPWPIEPRMMAASVISFPPPEAGEPFLGSRVVHGLGRTSRCLWRALHVVVRTDVSGRGRGGVDDGGQVLDVEFVERAG